MLSRIETLPISEQVIRLATTLRQQKSMSLGDAIIAATAIQYKKTIVTANSQDFKALEGISVIDPREG